MSKWLAVGLVVGVVGSLAAGCSSAAAPMTVGQFCAEKATVECPQAVSDLCEVSQSACVSKRVSICSTYASAATSPNVTGAVTRKFVSDNVSDCIAVINNVYGHLGEMFSVIDYSLISGPSGDTSTVDYVCGSVFPGTVATMGQCEVDADCMDNNVCTPSNGGSKVKVCAPLTQRNDGDPCSDPGDVCPDGDSCQKNGNGEYVCRQAPEGVALGGPGAKCTTDADCDPARAGFCDTYQQKGLCEKYIEFTGKDCELYGR